MLNLYQIQRLLTVKFRSTLILPYFKTFNKDIVISWKYTTLQVVSVAGLVNFSVQKNHM